MSYRKTIFISHSSKDRDKVELLVQFIRKVCREQFDNEYDVYYAPDELSRSIENDSTDSLIIKRIKSANYLIVFYTPNAVFSRWVHFEVGVAKNYDIKIIPFVKDGVDCSSLIGNIPRTNMEEPQSIKNLLYRVFNQIDGYEPEWLSLYKEEMEQLYYKFKSKTAYIVGSKSIVNKKKVKMAVRVHPILHRNKIRTRMMKDGIRTGPIDSSRRLRRGLYPMDSYLRLFRKCPLLDVQSQVFVYRGITENIKLQGCMLLTIR